MIILDTNIASVSIRPKNLWDEPVAFWLGTLPRGELHIATITCAEIVHGIACLPEGKRKTGFEKRLTSFLHDLTPCTLPFDTPSANIYGQICAARRQTGQPIGVLSPVSSQRAEL